MTLTSQKIVLLGEGCVGKTSIVQRYLSNTFDENHVTTLKAGFFDKIINIEKTRLKLSIWDTAGQEKFHALGPIYYRDSKGAILVYDITDKDSFDRVRNWVIELKSVLGQECVLYIVGNKIDLERDRKVTESEAIEYAKFVGAIHMQTSAKQNKGIQELFLSLGKSLVKKIEETKHEEVASGSRRNKNGGNTGVKIVDDSNEDARSSCC